MASASRGSSLPPRDHLPQVHAIDVLHEEVVQPPGLAEVVQGDDVRVIQPRQRRASRVNRSSNAGFPATAGGKILRATSRSSRRWRAL